MATSAAGQISRNRACSGCLQVLRVWKKAHGLSDNAMICWIGILIAVAFAASSLKLGLYHAWTMLFNVLIAVYLGVRLCPFIKDFIPAGGEYQTTLGILAAGLVSFLILH